MNHRQDEATRRLASAWSALRPILHGGRVEQTEAFAKVMDSVEADRKNDLGRPMDFDSEGVI
jgi:hypothetical protein